MCNRIAKLFIVIFLSLFVAYGSGRGVVLKPDIELPEVDTPVQEEISCRCNNGMSVPCNPKYGKCNLETCSCDPITCDSSTCKNTGWTSCANGNYYRINRGCQDNICTITSRNYSCPRGSWGSLTSCDGTCSECPQNATCDLGLNSRYRCNLEFYDARDVAGKALCLKCPDNATCGNTIVGTVQCDQGYYRDTKQIWVNLSTDDFLAMQVTSYVCVKCPKGATTLRVGAKSKTECYLPKNTSSEETGEMEYYKDEYGEFEVSGNCFWTQ